MGVKQNGTATYSMLGRNGRDGNCLFEMAATIGYACAHGKMWSFPDWYGAWAFKSLPISPLPENLEIIREAGFHYTELPSRPFENVSLEGYLQSKKYFENVESLVKEQFAFNDAITKKCNDVKNMFSPRPITAVHFRFGDYVGNKFYCQLWETDYYGKAFDVLRFRPDPYGGWTPFVFVFSDDKTRAEEEIQKLRERFTFDYSIFKGDSSFEDICMMSMCDQHVIANSSFSWWGAFLSEQKKVLAPSRWFGETANLDTKDLIPENWIKI